MGKSIETKNAANATADKKTGKKKPRNPWTNAFVQVAEYLVKDYMDRVQVLAEHELFKNPMRIDAVIIKLEDGVVIDNAVMKFFKRHNVIEFKSPRDRKGIEEFDKTISYFHAYLSRERRKWKPPLTLDDVTLTIVSVKKPDRMLKVLREERLYKIVNTETSGIYHIIGDSRSPMIQLVVSSELPTDGDDQCLIWLRSLRNDLTKGEAVKVVKIAEDNNDDDHPLWSIVDFIMKVNPKILEEVEEEMTATAKVKQFYRNCAIKSGVAEEMGEEMAEEKAIAIAKKLLKRGDNVDDVVDVTGLDLNDVLRLKGEM